MTNDGNGPATAEAQVAPAEAQVATKTKRWPHPPKLTAWSSILLILAIGFPAAAAWLAFEFYSAFKTTVLPSQDALPLSVESASARSVSPACEEGVHPSKIPVVRLVAHTWNPRAGTLALDEELCVPSSMLEHLITLDYRSPFEHYLERTLVGRFPESRVRPQYAHDKISLHYTSYLPGENLSNQVFLPGSIESPMRSATLAQLFAAEDKFIQLGTIYINVTGTAPLYPFDQYATNGVFTLMLTSTSINDLVALNETIDKEKISESEALPFHIFLYENSGISPLGLTAATNRHESLRAETGSTAGHELSLRMERWTITITYILLIVAIPFLIEIFLIILLVRQGSGVRGPELLAGAATVLLAILPIRQVLVPPSVEELTLIDYLLGVEVAILVSIGSAAVWRTRKTEAGKTGGSSLEANQDPA
jgi:hypothetical protein